MNSSVDLTGRESSTKEPEYDLETPFVGHYLPEKTAESVGTAQLESSVWRQLVLLR